MEQKSPPPSSLRDATSPHCVGWRTGARPEARPLHPERGERWRRAAATEKGEAAADRAARQQTLDRPVSLRSPRVTTHERNPPLRRRSATPPPPHCVGWRTGARPEARPLHPERGERWRRAAATERGEAAADHAARLPPPDRPVFLRTPRVTTHEGNPPLRRRCATPPPPHCVGWRTGARPEARPLHPERGERWRRAAATERGEAAADRAARQQTPGLPVSLRLPRVMTHEGSPPLRRRCATPPPPTAWGGGRAPGRRPVLSTRNGGRGGAAQRRRRGGKPPRITPQSGRDRTRPRHAAGRHP